MNDEGEGLLTEDDLREIERDPGVLASWERIPRLVAEVRELRKLYAELAESTVTRAAWEAIQFERDGAYKAIEYTKLALAEACDLYDAAECVGPKRGEPERIAKLRRLT